VNEKDNIKRDELRFNFLKQMIIRLDYDFLFDEDIDTIIKKVYKKLIRNGYRMNSQTLAEFEINTQNIIENFNSSNNFVGVKNKRNEEFYSFSKEENKVRIDIARNFATMTVNYEIFKSFDELNSDFEIVVDEIIKVREGMCYNRIGLRKINAYLLRDINNINKYFEKSTIEIGNMCSEVIVKQNIEQFKMESNYKANKIINVNKVILTDKIKKTEENFYQIHLDIDVYNDSKMGQKEKINMKDINNNLFNIYKDSLTLNFLEQMKQLSFQNEEIIKLLEK